MATQDNQVTSVAGPTTKISLLDVLKPRDGSFGDFNTLADGNMDQYKGKPLPNPLPAKLADAAEEIGSQFIGALIRKKPPVDIMQTQEFAGINIMGPDGRPDTRIVGYILLIASVDKDGKFDNDLTAQDIAKLNDPKTRAAIVEQAGNIRVAQKTAGQELDSATLAALDAAIERDDRNNTLGKLEKALPNLLPKIAGERPPIDPQTAQIVNDRVVLDKMTALQEGGTLGRIIRSVEEAGRVAGKPAQSGDLAQPDDDRFRKMDEALAKGGFFDEKNGFQSKHLPAVNLAQKDNGTQLG